MTNIIVFSTCPNIKIAHQISESLVLEKLIACANIIPGIESIYRWKGHIEKDQEILLIMKSKQELFTQLVDRIEAIHPYDTPEITALEITQSSQKYSSWIIESTKDSKG